MYTIEINYPTCDYIKAIVTDDGLVEIQKLITCHAVSELLKEYVNLSLPPSQWVLPEIKIKINSVESKKDRPETSGLLDVEGPTVQAVQTVQASLLGQNHAIYIIREFILKAQNKWIYAEDIEICHCRKVTQTQILNSLYLGSNTPYLVMQKTKAGSGCGQCVQDIEKLLLQF